MSQRHSDHADAIRKGVGVMEFEFLVAKSDIKGLPGLEKGAVVMRVTVEVLEGGYEYDVWHRLDNGMVAKTRIGHRDEFDVLRIDAETHVEAIEKLSEAISRM